MTKINIIIPFRPEAALFKGMAEKGYSALQRCLRHLIKKSFHEYNFIIAIDADIQFDYSQIEIFKNHTVRVIQSPHEPDNSKFENLLSFRRVNLAFLTAINSIPDEEWLCYSYICDLICSKEWDKPIIEAIQQHGENHVYVPMWVESYISYGTPDWCQVQPDGKLQGIEPTPELIWKTWREKICCHELIMPCPPNGYVNEKDFDHYISIALKEKPDNIIESCGKREYGYYNVMFMKAKHGKRAMQYYSGFDVGSNVFDLNFDDRLGERLCNLQKVVVTNSFVLHPIPPAGTPSKGYIENEEEKKYPL